MDAWLLSQFACPRHKTPLQETSDDRLACREGCSFPVVDGIPVLLLEEAAQTPWVADASIQQAEKPEAHAPWFTGSLGVSEPDRLSIRERARTIEGIDPIPELRLPCGDGEVLVAIGCNWGRWCIAAARKGYRPIGVDPSLGAVMAGRRLARQLSVVCSFVVADGRYLPFRSGCADRVFSYSMLQHLEESSVLEVLKHVPRGAR